MAAGDGRWRVWLDLSAAPGEAGELTVGQLVSFLGYGLFMVGPIRTFFELAQKATRALVSARKAIAIGAFAFGTFGLGFLLGGLVFGRRTRRA